MPRKPLAQCIAQLLWQLLLIFLPPVKPQGNLMKALKAIDKNFEAIHLLFRRWMTSITTYQLIVIGTMIILVTTLKT